MVKENTENNMFLRAEVLMAPCAIHLLFEPHFGKEEK